MKRVRFFRRYCAYIGDWYNKPREWREFMSLTFEEFRQKNLERSNFWHDGTIDNWSPAEWGNAAVGELGDLCNILKKILRFDKCYTQAHTIDRILERKELIRMAGEGIADTQIYLDLIASRLGIRIEDVLIEKFNSVSIEINSNLRLVGD